MPTPEEIEAAAVFLGKAASDLAATRLLARLPVDIREADWLNPWAVTVRYDHLGGTLDRRLALEVADKSVVWARDRVNAARGDENGG